MTETITWCVRGCTRTRADGEVEPKRADRGRLCRGCYQRLDGWLLDIPDRYATLPEYLLPTTDVDRNPDSVATKRTHAPAPVRVDVMDLLDGRRGRKWQGLVPTDERRGTLGTLMAWSAYVRAGRNTSTSLAPTVSREADCIRRNLDWLAADDAISDAYDEIRVLYRQLGDAIGEYPPKPVGVCKTLDDEGEEGESCGGPLIPTYTGVRCHRCGREWDHTMLRHLGRTLSEDAG